MVENLTNCTLYGILILSNTIYRGGMAKQLQLKYWKALELLEEGTMSNKEIAVSTGISLSYLHNLIEESPDTGESGHLFQSELRKMNNRKAAKIRTLVKNNQKLSMKLLQDELQRMSNNPNLTDTDLRRLIEINNSLSKSKPSIEIGSVSYSRGLQREDLVHEFKRLASVARSALIRQRVRSTGNKGSRILPSLDGSGDIVSEESETPLLHPESEAGEVPQE